MSLKILNMKPVVVLVLTVLYLNPVKSQDIHFSQFQETPLQLNPSFAGGFSGDQRVILNYRNQWASMGAPFKTYDLSFDTKINSKNSNAYLGIGAFIFKDKSGDLDLGTFQANLNIAGHVKINNEQTFSAGIMGGFVQKSIDISNAQWGSQFDGVSFDPSLPQGNYTFQSFNYMDLKGGISWFYKRGAATMSSNDNFWIRAGLSVSHLTKAKQQFYVNQVDKIGLKPLFFSQAHIGIPNIKIAIRPQIMWTQQVKQAELVIGTMFRYKLAEASKYTGAVKESAVSFGAMYRVNDAIIPTASIEFKNYALGISYDFNISSLKSGTSGNGGFEISLKFLNPNPFGNRSSARFF